MRLLKRHTLFFVALIMLLSACGQQTGTAGEEYGSPIQGGVILHAWCWSFSTIAENMPEIAAAGYTAVQTSPITECIDSDTSAPGEASGNQLNGDGAWWFHYQPVSFRIGNYQLGTEEEFAEMCRVAKEHGVKIIVDAVLNHMTGSTRKIDEDFRNLPNGGGIRARMAFGDTRERQTQGRLLGLADINTHNPRVQKIVLDYLKRCVELGASGFRYDAIFCIERPDEAESELSSNFWPVVLDNGAEFQYGEILGVAEANQYVSLMNVTDAVFGQGVVEALRKGEMDASQLTNFKVGAEAKQLVTWVESHDTYCNAGETAKLTTQQILYGWAMIAAREGSTSLFYSRPDGWSAEGASRWGNNIIGERGSAEFLAPEVVAINHFKKAMTGTEERISNPSNSLQLLMIERGGSGAVIVNMGPEAQLQGSPVQLLPDGEYTDELSGNVFTVADGKLSGTVAAESIIVFYKTVADGSTISE